MLAAITRGKLSQSVEGSEDVLTSIVFGLIEHLPVKDGLELFLGRLRGSEPAPRDIVNWRIEYWPWWDEDESGRRQPDVVLHLTDRAGKTWMLIIEAKLRSGKSGTGEDDQLACQVRLGARIAARNQEELAGLVYLTADHSTPHGELNASRTALENWKHAPASFWWASWRDFVELFDKVHAGGSSVISNQAGEASACLKRWGLDWFRGFSAAPTALPELRYGRRR